MTGKHGTVEERLWRNCIPEPNSGCWLWLASLQRNGYAQIMMHGGKPRRAHRIAYRIFKGEVPRGLDVRHTCDIRCCINPDHLLLGTRKQNMEDAAHRGRIAKRFKLPQCRLSDEQVTAIIKDRRTQREIAATYGIDQGYVSRLKNGLAARTKGGAQ